MSDPTVRTKSKRQLVFALVAVATVAVAAWWVWALTGWREVTVPLDTEFALQLSRKQSHPFLAEFQRKVSILRSGRHAATLGYPQDTGGGFPMEVRLYADQQRRLVRLTDHLYDRLIDLDTGRFVEDATPPEGKEFSSFVAETNLPPLRRTFEIGRSLEALQR